MELVEIVNKLVGNINPIGKSEVDAERFENLKVMCELVDALVEQIDGASYRNKDAYEASVVRARDYAFNFLTETLGIEYAE